MIYIVLCIFYSSNQSKIFRNYILSNICVTLEASPQTSMENYWFKLNKGDSSMQSAFNRTALDKKQFHLNIKIIFSMLQSVLILSLITCGFTEFQINVFFFHKTSHESCIISFCSICFLEHSPFFWKEGFYGQLYGSLNSAQYHARTMGQSFSLLILLAIMSVLKISKGILASQMKQTVTK